MTADRNDRQQLAAEAYAAQFVALDERQRTTQMLVLRTENPTLYARVVQCMEAIRAKTHPTQ